MKKKLKKKIRPLANITSDLELLLQEMTDENGHDMQWGEILYFVYGYMSVHLPHAQEVYTEDGRNPIFFYGWKEEATDECGDELKDESGAW